MQYQSLIGGKWLSANSKEVMKVTNPANGELLGEVPNCGVEETLLAIDSARTALKTWRQTSPFERASILHKIADYIRPRSQEFAKALTLEQGKPLKESLIEIEFGLTLISWFAEEAKRICGDILESPRAGYRSHVLYEPVGVCAAITPWNFPFSMMARKVAPALAAGCSVILKPAPETPITAILFAKACTEAGLPPGVFNCVTGEAEKIGATLMSSPVIRKVSFTGSTAVGKLLIRQSADTVKKLTLELGGNAPFIIFDDADLNVTVQAALGAKYRNAGQACIGINRFLIQEGIYSSFIEQYKKLSSNLKVGNGLEDGTDLGPLIATRQVDRIRGIIEDALQQGAELILGEVPSKDTHWVKPTILVGITPSMRAWREEIFGPVSMIRKFSTEEQAVELANDTVHGLAAYVFSKDSKRCQRVMSQLEAGMVCLNDFSLAGAQIPFCGIKESGYGVEGGKQAIYQYLQSKYVSIGAD